MVSSPPGPGPGAEAELVPAGFCLRPDAGTRVLAGGTVLAGGSPIRVLRLTPSGARHVAGWWSGTPVPDNPRARALARRLLDIGIAQPSVGPAGPGGSRVRHDVTVVIPVRDRQAELARCLSALAGMPRVIVVDDASADPAAVARVASQAGATMLRRPVNGGPGGGRGKGMGGGGGGGGGGF
jgi:mycofactocin glycosyltransferase